MSAQDLKNLAGNAALAGIVLAVVPEVVAALAITVVAVVASSGLAWLVCKAIWPSDF
jgi:hypothetical protein